MYIYTVMWSCGKEIPMYWITTNQSHCKFHIYKYLIRPIIQLSHGHTIIRSLTWSSNVLVVVLDSTCYLFYRNIAHDFKQKQKAWLTERNVWLTEQNAWFTEQRMINRTYRTHDLQNKTHVLVTISFRYYGYV